MFYETANNDHGLPHDPLKSCVVPRPIGWISSLAADGTPNLAPYSFFNLLCASPPVVGYASNGRGPAGPKDTVTNIEATGEFVYSMATWDQREAMNRTSAPVPPDVDEFEHAGLQPLPSRLVRPARVAGSPVHFECRLLRTVDLPARAPDVRNVLVLGEVVGVHIDDAALVEGQIDVARLRPIARLGYWEYACVEQVFRLPPPGRS